MQNSQAIERVKKLHDEFIDSAKQKDYDEIVFSIGELETQNGKEFVKEFLNFKNDNDKTLIHHLIENPNNGYFDELWAVVELRLKGAKVDIADKLGNTALHSCAYFHQKCMQAQVKSVGLTDYPSNLSIGLVEVKTGKRPADERIMFACMAEVGALIFCGANPSIKNQKGETVFELMASVAAMLKPDSAKPNITEAACKNAFLVLFKREKRSFSPDDLFKGKIEYPWAPNVVGWAESLKIDDSVKNASLVAQSCTLF